jgi:type I restriction enzyme S subunit
MKLALKPVAIGEVVERSKIWNPSRSSADEVFQYIDLSAVDQDAKLITGAREVPCGEAPSRARQLVESGDILVSTVRPNLNGVARVPEQLDGATASTGFCVLRANKTKANGAYLFHWVKSPAFITDMISKATGASYPAVSDRIIFDSQIPLPPLAEQKRIAAILDAADALRTKRREALAQLDALLQSSFLTLFGDPVTNPMRWEVCQLGDVCRGKPTYGSGSSACEYDPSLPRYVRITDVDDAGNLSNDPKCAQLTKKEIEKYSLREGDILFARSGATVGKSYLHRAANGNCVYAGYMIRFCPDPLKMLPETLFRFTQTVAYWRWVNSQARVVAQPNINAQIYSSMPVIIPPLPLQQKFATIVESIERQKAAQRAHLAELDALFAALQHRAFRGEL